MPLFMSTSKTRISLGGSESLLGGQFVMHRLIRYKCDKAGFLMVFPKSPISKIKDIIDDRLVVHGHLYLKSCLSLMTS